MQQMYVHVTPAELSLKEIKKNLYIQNTWIGWGKYLSSSCLASSLSRRCGLHILAKKKNKTNISQYRPNKVVRYKRFQLALRVTLIFFKQISDSK